MSCDTSPRGLSRSRARRSPGLDTAQHTGHLRVGAAAGGPGSDSSTHYDARTTHNTCDKSPRVSSRSHMVHSARHAAQRIHTRAKTGPRALNGCPHTIVPCATRRDTSSHVSPPLTQPFRRNSCRDGRARLGHIEYVRLEKLPATRRFSAGSGISGISVAGVRTAGGSPKWP